ncbi:sulfatase family protein [Niastella populi]|uniref:Heparan N-sulfatase n=1 Tax=Niastella populi TaxID=550983 RepID=A0A1V9FKH5_9BACT|nr:sulfatase [Niastella populi]OQP58869.1 heparan N-sulfatase [Niastella populi]
MNKKCHLILITLLVQLSLNVQTAVGSDSTEINNARRPNVVIIMADDLDSRQLSCYGGRNIKTTNIDKLAAEGMKFNQMIASEAMCVPTRASLFTGLYPMRHGSFQNHKGVYDSLKSVCHYLGDLGYKVALTGKDHSTRPAAVFPFTFIKGFEPNCVAATDDYTLQDIRQFITTQSGDPFCLFIMSINPHMPWTMGDPSEFRADQLQLPAHWVDTKETRTQYCKFLAEVRRLDNQVGDVMQLLKETGHEKNTIFIFLGEQGPQFPGGKWNLWDYGQKSSMIIRWPGVVKPGTASEAIIQYEDITPTLCALAGGKAPDDLDGKNFLPVMLGRGKENRQYAFGIHNNIPEGTPYPIRSIRDKRYKLIMNLSPEIKYYNKFMMNPNHKNSLWSSWLKKDSTSPGNGRLITRITTRPALELYDLQKDPYELNNLAGDAAYATLVKTYSARLKEWMKQQNDDGASVDRVYQLSK